MDLLKITVHTKDSGFDVINEDLATESKIWLEYAVDMALKAFKSKVPINSGELRNHHLLDHIEGNTGIVYVDETAYIGFNGGKGKKSGRRDSAATVAKILDEGDSRSGFISRRNTSVPAFSKFSSVPRGNKTEGWIDLAEQDFERVISGE